MLVCLGILISGAAAGALTARIGGSAGATFEAGRTIGVGEAAAPIAAPAAAVPAAAAAAAASARPPVSAAAGGRAAPALGGEFVPGVDGRVAGRDTGAQPPVTVPAVWGVLLSFERRSEW